MDKIKFVYRFQAGTITCTKTFVPDGDKVWVGDTVSGKKTMGVWVPVVAAREILSAALKAGWVQVFPAPVGADA
jgi:hypothetical protein